MDDAGVEVPDHAIKLAAGFVGRQWVLERIDKWLKDGPERYFLITGEPGSGKSALAAWLAGAGPVPDDLDLAAALARIRGSWSAAHFVVGRTQGGTVDPTQFAQSLAGQLARRHDGFAAAALKHLAPQVVIAPTVDVGENWGRVIGANIKELVVVGGSNPREVFNRAVRAPLKDLATERLKERSKLSVHILVDSLDEALLAEGDGIVELLAGSGDLPSGVRFLLTSRHEPRVLDRLDFDEVCQLDLSSDEHALEAEADLRTYITTRLAADKRPRPSPADGQDLEAQLMRKADANFLYATWVLDELARPKRQDVDITALPPGLHGLYKSYLDRLLPKEPNQFREAWKGHERFLGCLSVATPAAPATVLPKWLEWTDDNELALHVEEFAQLIEQITDLPDEDYGYRLYHRSITDFLSARVYKHRGALKQNKYYVKPSRQHDRIASHYLRMLRDKDEWNGNWARSDTYGLRQLVSHLRARLESGEREYQARLDDLYAVATDPRFHAVQRQRLQGIHATLADLRTTLDVALDHNGGNDLVQALRCVAAFRGITRSEGLSRAVFSAVESDDIPMALQKLSHYGSGTTSGGGWSQILKLYLAWEAAEAGSLEDARAAFQQTDPLVAPAVAPLAGALLTRTATALARQGGDPRHWLEEFGRTQDAASLLQQYAVTTDLDPAEVQRVIAEVEPQIQNLERLTAHGSAEAASAQMFIDEQPDTIMDPETNAEVASSLQDDLRRIAASPAGQALIDRAIASVLTNPYPRYRDSALGALGTAQLGSPDPLLIRPQLQAVLRAGLDDEGVTFTFDLPSVVLAEWEARGQSAPELASYLQTAASSHDVWGTSMRARSAQAAASLRRGTKDSAFALLQEASAAPTTYAGYGVTAVLALIDRCHELGQPERAAAPLWGPGRDRGLYDIAADIAGRVYDPVFRDERRALVDAHQAWSREAAPRPDLARQRQSEFQDADMRGAYQRHVSARWASAGEQTRPAWLGTLVPTALFDSTTLDTILGRLLAARCGELQDQHLQAIVELTTTEFTTGRPWSFGSWRPLRHPLAAT
jgi:hypothetical protein